MTSYNKEFIEPGEIEKVTMVMKPYRVTFYLSDGVSVSTNTNFNKDPIMHIQGEISLQYLNHSFGLNICGGFTPDDDTSKSKSTVSDVPAPVGAGAAYQYNGLKKGSFSFQPGCKVGYFPYRRSWYGSSTSSSGKYLTTTYMKFYEQRTTFIEPRVRFGWGQKKMQFFYEFSAGFGNITIINPFTIGLLIRF